MHILQRKAKTTDYRDAESPKNANYDFEAGVWRNESGLLSYDPDYTRVSKKNDIETGEDQKGQ